jgi:hypothetical protein
VTAQQLALVEVQPSPAQGRPLVALRLNGEPMPWSRPKPFHMGTRIVERFSGPFGAWRVRAIRTVASWWAGRDTIRVPVIAEVLAVVERPPRPPRATIDGQLVVYPWPWTDDRRPALTIGDVDNYAKAMLDILQQTPKPIGMELTTTPVLADDRLVVELRARRLYAALGEEPCTEVRLWIA